MMRPAVHWWIILGLAGVFILIPSTGMTAAERVSVRGVWVHPGHFGTDRGTALSKMQNTLDEYQRAGINTLMVLVKSTSGHVYFSSKIGVQDPAWKWDFFGTFLEEARKRQMDVHPWFCVFTEGGLLGPVREHPEWLITGKKGELFTSVNPALPEVRGYELSLMLELIRLYQVDWVHLDYIRFPCTPSEPCFSYDSRTRALFKLQTGQDPLEIVHDNSGNPVWNEWIAWNSDRVTLFLKELREALKSAGRPVSVSAAVFPSPDTARVLIGQDWEAWAKEGLVDMLCPMLYTNNDDLFEKYLKRALEAAAGRVRLCAGIGIATSHNKNTAERMARQMAAGRRMRTDGDIFFSSSSLTGEFLEKLKTLR